VGIGYQRVREIAPVEGALLTFAHPRSRVENVLTLSLIHISEPTRLL